MELATLVDSSLLAVIDVPANEAPDAARSASRAVVLETIREYGLEQLEAHGETE